MNQIKRVTTARALPHPHSGFEVCIICGKDNPGCSIIVMPDKPPEPQFLHYAASAHLVCFLKCRILKPEEVN